MNSKNTSEPAPAALGPHLQKARTALERGHTEQAQALCQYALAQAPFSLDVNILWYQAHCAKAAFEPSLLLKLKTAAYRFFWFFPCLYHQGKPSAQTLLLAQKILERYPTYPPALRLWAVSAQSLDLHALACFAYERAIRHAKKAQRDYVALAQLCQQNQFFQKGLLVAEEGLQRYPDCTQLQKAIKDASMGLSLAAGAPFSKKI